MINNIGLWSKWSDAFQFEFEWRVCEKSCHATWLLKSINILLDIMQVCNIPLNIINVYRYRKSSFTQKILSKISSSEVSNLDIEIRLTFNSSLPFLNTVYTSVIIWPQPLLGVWICISSLRFSWNKHASHGVWSYTTLYWITLPLHRKIYKKWFYFISKD